MKGLFGKLWTFCEIALLMGLRDLRFALTVPSLWKVDALLFVQYLFRFPPLFIARDRRELPYRGENFFYGETPYYTAERLCRLATVTKDDVVYDLGCGRGKFVFYAHVSRGCRAVGLELIETYVAATGAVRNLLGLEGVRVLHGDFLGADLSPATVVYIHGSFFTDDVRARLRERIDDLAPGVRWLSVSVRWEHPALAPVAEELLDFSWGKEPVYVYEVIAGAPQGGSQ